MRTDIEHPPIATAQSTKFGAPPSPLALSEYFQTMQYPSPLLFLPCSVMLPNHIQKLSSRLAPLGRKGHSASVVPLGGHLRVLIFGGAPAGRRGLSNALYSVGLAQLSAGQGTWERHRPAGAAPAPRQGHSLTAVAGGKRLVLFGGVAENGELLGDIQVRKDSCKRPRRR